MTYTADPARATAAGADAGAARVGQAQVDGGSGAGTAGRILDIAERLVQVRGFNGFSYADVAAELAITKAALHYHFTSKAQLGQALVDRYAARFERTLAGLDAGGGPAAGRLRGYAAIYADVLRRDRMCLCGMLAAEYQTLPQPMRAGVLAFFELNEKWLESVLVQGAADGSLRCEGPAREAARMILAAMEGALLVARPHRDVGRFEATAASLLAGLTRQSAQSPA